MQLAEENDKSLPGLSRIVIPTVVGIIVVNFSSVIGAWVLSALSITYLAGRLICGFDQNLTL